MLPKVRWEPPRAHMWENTGADSGLARPSDRACSVRRAGRTSPTPVSLVVLGQVASSSKHVCAVSLEDALREHILSVNG